MDTTDATDPSLDIGAVLVYIPYGSFPPSTHITFDFLIFTKPLIKIINLIIKQSVNQLSYVLTFEILSMQIYPYSGCT